MKGLMSSAFIVFIIAWAVIDLTSLQTVTGALLDMFVVLVKAVASAAEAAVT